MAKKKTANLTKTSSPGSKKPVRKIVKGNKNKNRSASQQQSEQVEVEEPRQGLSEEDGGKESGSGSQGSEDSGEQGSSNDEDNQDQQDQSSSSITPIKPENYAVKQIQFRERRGTKMNYLMTRQKEEEEDPFWAEHKGIFGDLNAEDDDDEEDYVESGSGRDRFDSDFGDTESEHDEDADADDDKKGDQMDEEKLKEKKRRAQLMKKVNPHKEKPKRSPTSDKHKIQLKTEAAVKKHKNPDHYHHSSQKPHEELSNRYIHQLFTQEQLLGEAAHTEYYNWLSLKKLISIETEKKDFTKKVRHVDGDKIVYRSRLAANGVPASQYELFGVVVGEVEDLTRMWQAK